MHLILNVYYTIISKNRQKFKNTPIVKKAQAVMLISYRRALYNFKTIGLKPYEEIHFTVTIYYTIISKIQKWSDRQTRI